MGKKPSAAIAGSIDEELHAAARSGDLKAVQAICSTNPLAVNSRDRHSRTPYPHLFSLLFLFILFSPNFSPPLLMLLSFNFTLELERVFLRV